MKGHKSWIIPVLFLGVPILVAGTLLVVLDLLETVVPGESELAKYPHMEPFLFGRTGFRGIEHHLDTGKYSFAFFTTAAAPEKFFETVDDRARAENWTIEHSKPDKRVYQRPTDGPCSVMLRVTLLYNSSNSEVTFIQESVSADSG